MPDEPVDDRRAPRKDRDRWLPHDLHGVHVLVVDDHADSRYILQRVLEYCGAFVSVGASVREGLDLMRIARPNVIVTDLNMKDGDGYDLLAAVRTVEADGRRRIPAVIVTAQPPDDHRQRALDAGFADVLTKPFDFDVLCRLLRRLVDQK